MAWRRVFAILVLLITFSATLCLGDETEGTASEDDSSENEEDAEETRDENANVDDEVKEEDDVLVLITKTFDSVVNDKDVILVEFYAPCSVKPCDGETTDGKTEMSNNNGAKKKSKKGGEALSLKCQNEVAGRSNNAGGGGGGGSDDEDNRKPHVPLSRYERDDQAFAAESDDDGGSNADDYKCEVKLAKKRKGIEDISIHGGDGNEDDGNQGESDCSVPPLKLKRPDAEVNCQAPRGYMKNNSLPDDRNWKCKHDKLSFEHSPPRTLTVTLPGNLGLLPFETGKSASFASDTGENSFTSATILQNQRHVVGVPDFGSDMFSGVNLMQQQHRQNVEESSNCSARSGMASLQLSRMEKEDELPASPLSASSMPGVRQASGSVSIPQEVLWPLNRAHLSVGDDGSYVENVHWEQIGDIGRGSFGQCYKCEDLKTGKPFVIKLIREDSFEMTGLEIWGTMSGRHENILELYGAVKSCGKITIFMEYVSGGSLKEPKKLDEGRALNIYSKILSGIEFMHFHGYFHRDISGANILIDDRGETVKLADFNLSIRLDYGYQQDNNPRGTLAFMAPEVCRSANHSFSADIWSATCVFYQMLTGTRPWEQYHHPMTLLYQIGSASEPPPLPECSLKVKELLNMGFELTPEKRATATKLLNHRAFKSDDDDGDYGDDVIGVGDGASGSTNATDSNVSSAEGDEWQ